MVEAQKETLLHLTSKHTNLSVPYSKYISLDTFPEQNEELLETMITIHFRNMYDIEVYDLHEPEESDPHDIITANCKVIRCDNTEPFVMIAVSDDYKFIFVMDSRDDCENKVYLYPIQSNEYIGIEGLTEYHNIHEQDQIIIDHKTGLRAITLRVDNGEPCYSVIMEFMPDNKVRFLLGDECLMKLLNYYIITNDAPKPVLTKVNSEEELPATADSDKIFLVDAPGMVPKFYQYSTTKGKMVPFINFNNLDSNQVHGYEPYPHKDSFKDKFDENRSNDLIIIIRKALLEEAKIWH